MKERKERINIYPKKEMVKLAKEIKQETGITLSQIFEFGVVTLRKVRK